MCGRVRLSSDVSEIKLVFSIPPAIKDEHATGWRNRKFADSPLEGDGFELSVPGDGQSCYCPFVIGAL
jgi:hypothetical protein